MPIVHVYRGSPQTGNDVHAKQRYPVFHFQITDFLDRVRRSTRCFVLHHRDHLRLELHDRFFHGIKVMNRLIITEIQHPNLASQRLGHIAESLAEQPGRKHQHPISRFQRAF